MRVWEICAYKMAAWYPATLSVLIQQILFIMARAAATNFSWGGRVEYTYMIHIPLLGGGALPPYHLFCHPWTQNPCMHVQ